MTEPKRPDVVLEGALVLEVGTAEAEPAAAVVLLVGVPVTLDQGRTHSGLRRDYTSPHF